MKIKKNSSYKSLSHNSSNENFHTARGSLPSNTQSKEFKNAFLSNQNTDQKIHNTNLKTQDNKDPNNILNLT